MSPTERTLAMMRGNGYLCAVVEKWNPHVPRGDGGKGLRQDLFGFVDILAVRPWPLDATVYIQTTDGSSLTKRIAKVLSDKTLTHRASTLLHAGNTVIFHGWKKLKAGPRVDVCTLGLTSDGIVVIADRRLCDKKGNLIKLLNEEKNSEPVTATQAVSDNQQFELA